MSGRPRTGEKTREAFFIVRYHGGSRDNARFPLFCWSRGRMQKDSAWIKRGIEMSVTIRKDNARMKRKDRISVTIKKDNARNSGKRRNMGTMKKDSARNFLKIEKRVRIKKD